MTEPIQERNCPLYICAMVHATLSALIGAGAGLLLSLLFYPALLATASIPVWQSWRFVFQVSGLGGFSAFIGGLCFALLFFRRDIGRFVFLKGLFFLLVSLMAAAGIYGLVLHQYRSFFLAGYQSCLFFFIAALPWFATGFAAMALRGWVMKRSGRYGT